MSWLILAHFQKIAFILAFVCLFTLMKIDFCFNFVAENFLFVAETTQTSTYRTCYGFFDALKQYQCDDFMIALDGKEYGSLQCEKLVALATTYRHRDPHKHS